MKRRLLITLAIVGLLAAIPLSRAGAATQTTSNVTLMSDPSVVVGTSTLTRTGAASRSHWRPAGWRPVTR